MVKMVANDVEEIAETKIRDGLAKDSTVPDWRIHSDYVEVA